MRLKYTIMVSIVFAMLILAGCNNQTPDSSSDASDGSADMQDSMDDGAMQEDNTEMMDNMDDMDDMDDSSMDDAEMMDDSMGDMSEDGMEDSMSEDSMSSSASSSQNFQSAEIYKDRARDHDRLYGTEEVGAAVDRILVPGSLKCNWDEYSIHFQIANPDNRAKYLGRMWQRGDTRNAIKVSLNARRLNLAEICGDGTLTVIHPGEVIDCQYKVIPTRSDLGTGLHTNDIGELEWGGTTYQFSSLKTHNAFHATLFKDGESITDSIRFSCPSDETEEGLPRLPDHLVVISHEEGLAHRLQSESHLPPNGDFGVLLE